MQQRSVLLGLAIANLDAPAVQLAATQADGPAMTAAAAVLGKSMQSYMYPLFSGGLCARNMQPKKALQHTQQQAASSHDCTKADNGPDLTTHCLLGAAA